VFLNYILNTQVFMVPEGSVISNFEYEVSAT